MHSPRQSCRDGKCAYHCEVHAPARQRIVFGMVVTSGVWAAWNGVGFALDSSTRHRAEAAWFIFAAVLLVAALMLGRRAFTVPPGPVPGRHAFRRVAPLILIAGSLLLYAPVLSIGLLSDDFVLLQRVRDGVLIDRSWNYVRPLPLAVWQIAEGMLPATVVPLALHTLNAMVHGLNAWLVLLCASRMQLSPPRAWCAAWLFLVAPYSVETVAWASSVFDLMLTSFVLISAAVMLGDRLSSRARVGVVAILAASAAASKETAIAQPLLLALLIPFAPREHRRAAWWSAAAAMAVMMFYAGWRAGSGISGAPLIPTSGYAAKEMFSRPFGAFGYGIHRQVLEAVPPLGPMVALSWPIVFVAAAWRWHRDPGIFKVAALSAAWMLVSTLPLLAMFFVSDDLQGSRYLYLGAAMWAIATVRMLGGAIGNATPVFNAVMICVLASAVALVLAHQRPWVHAAQVRDRVLAALPAVPPECIVLPAALPDHEAGAYVFRNGFREAAALVHRTTPAGSTSCSAIWRGSGFEVKE